MGLRIPPGERPAVLVIDMQYDFCDPDAPTTLWPSIGETYRADQAAVRGSARARTFRSFTRRAWLRPTAHRRAFGASSRRFHAEMRVQIEGSRGAEIIAELAPQAGDRVIRKWRPSAFFRTDLEVFLGARRIDTLLCCGTSVSGCVRATVTDAFMRDIRCMVIRECVADRTRAVMDANLFDLASEVRGGDVAHRGARRTSLVCRTDPLHAAGQEQLGATLR